MAVLPEERKTPQEIEQLFSSNSIPWFNDGRWGLSGYAIPATTGKTWTENDQIWRVHDSLGMNLFELMHRRNAVQFNKEPHKSFLWDLHQLLTHSRKNLNDRRVDPSTEINRVEEHAVAAKRVFLVYPVPFFGGRVRQRDIQEWCGIALKLLTEMMSNSENERAGYIGGDFVDMCNGYIDEILLLMATRYFGMTKTEVLAAMDASPEGTFSIPTEKWVAYKGFGILLNTERTTERPPADWWPTARDLSAIKGIPITDAIHFSELWPDSITDGHGDWETTLPGLVDRTRRDEPEKAPNREGEGQADLRKAP